MVRSEQLCSLLPPVHGCKSLFFRKLKEPDVEPSGVLLLAGPPGCPSGLQWLQLSSRVLYEHHVRPQPFQDHYMACTMSLEEGWAPGLYEQSSIPTVAFTWSRTQPPRLCCQSLPL